MPLFPAPYQRQRGFLAAFSLLCLLLAAGFWYGSRSVYAFGKLSENTARDILRRYTGDKSSVKVKSVESLGNSAVVVAQIETAFRFTQDAQGHWLLAEIRRGDNNWEDVRALAQLLENERQARARAELDLLAQGLANFRQERGFYVRADNIVSLTDALSPRYVRRLLRLDPWHRPYEYAADAAGYTLSSRGADGQSHTADDLIVRP